MSDPNIFHRTTRDQNETVARRASQARLNRTVLLVVIATTVWGVMAFVLISDRGTATLATVLIGLAALTVRLVETD